MYDAFIIAVLPLLWIALNISSFLIIAIHELGHAIPALIFTKQDVTIYIGTYGDNSSPKFKFGRLTIYIRPKFSYLKNRGLCNYKTNISFGRQVFIIIAGPTVVAFIMLTLISWMFSDTNIYTEVLIATCLVSAIINLVVNLFPKKIIVQNSTRLYYSDGYQLILLAENKSNYQHITAACKYYDGQDFAEALTHLKKVNDKYMDESVFSLMLGCYIALKNYSLVKKLNKAYEQTRWYKLISADDYAHLAYADMQLKHYEPALVYLNRSVTLNPDKFDSLNNRGYVHNMLNNYASAKEDLNKAIFIDGSVSSAYSNRAFANLGLGRAGEALIDIEKAFELDPSNSYAYLTKGMYLFEKEKFTTALENFEKAKLLDEATMLVDEYIVKTKEKIPVLKPVKKRKTNKK